MQTCFPRVNRYAYSASCPVLMCLLYYDSLAFYAEELLHRMVTCRVSRYINPKSVVKHWRPGFRQGFAPSRLKLGHRCTIGSGLLDHASG